MKKYRFRLVGVFAILASTWFGPGCGRDQSLVSITVTPQTTTITGAGLFLQFTALGNYIHPPESKDITTQVVWASQADQILTFDNTGKPGLAVSGDGCGTNIGVSATVYEKPSLPPPAGPAVVGTAVVNVKQPGCQ